jgi:hypothetical protein
LYDRCHEELRRLLPLVLVNLIVKDNLGWTHVPHFPDQIPRSIMEKPEPPELNSHESPDDDDDSDEVLE